MKNKIKRTLTALCAALMLMGGFSVTAFAQTPENDATNDTGVVVEETEDTPPLTPDGNATLVDDYGGNKQLITVTTKSGNYGTGLFAIIIHPTTFYCSFLCLDMLTQYLLLAKIIHIIAG